MTLINALVSTPEDLDFRLHLRNEFMRIGLGDVLEVPEALSEMLSVITVFKGYRGKSM